MSNLLEISQPLADRLRADEIRQKRVAVVVPRSVPPEILVFSTKTSDEPRRVRAKGRLRVSVRESW
jgi:hypothetical protein